MTAISALDNIHIKGCFGDYKKMNRNELIKIKTINFFGYHPAALPKNRGRHPIIWALALGLKKTASTFFFIDEGADTGNLIDQRMVLIDEEDEARALYLKLIEQAKKQLKDILPIINNKNYHGTPQDDSLSNYWRKRDKSDGQIDWRMSADMVHMLVKALSKPYIGAHFTSKNIEYKVWKSKGPLTLFLCSTSFIYGADQKIARSPIVFGIGSCQEMRETTIGSLASFRRTPSVN